MKRRLASVVVGVWCCLLTGCYQKVSDSNGMTCSLETWVPLLVVLGGVAAVPVGIVMFRFKKRFAGVCLAILGPIAAATLAPGMFLDRVTVNEEGFYSRHGFWWDPKIHEIRYADLNSVHLGVEEKRGRKGRKTYSYHFDCSFKSGKQERVPLGDLMREAMPEIAEQFRYHGVSVEIPPDLQN